MVEGMYEKTTTRVVVGEGASDEFEVNIGLRQGSVLSPLLFIAVGLMDLISRKTVMKDAMKKLLYAALTTWPWCRMANRSYKRHWRSGTGVNFFIDFLGSS